ncbi:MAG TPA: hypothetical protein VE046_12965 [Steroidobacteraceae bacterium]|nr:hypothetical protein [Steroidobacteraceae bacterium]
MRSYLLLSGILFSVIAIVQALRLAQGWTVVIAGWNAPMAVSIVAVVITAGLAIWAFRLLGGQRAP